MCRRADFAADRNGPSAEMLGELQALRLIVRTAAGAVEHGRTPRHVLIDEAADELAVLQDERHLVAADQSIALWRLEVLR